MTRLFSYDLLIAGAGISGASLALSIAKAGADVLVLESTKQFRDRVRGEFIFPWGVNEAKRLGIYATIVSAGGHEIPWMDMYGGPKKLFHGNLANTTKAAVPAVTFYQPKVQEALAETMESAGIEIIRGARAKEITADYDSSIVKIVGVEQCEVRTRLVVGADGRKSTMRSLGDFKPQRDNAGNLVSGILFDEMDVADDAAHHWANPKLGLSALLFPQGKGRVRAYLCHQSNEEPRLSGHKDIGRFTEGFINTGVPVEIIENAVPTGPLATFDGTHIWVDHPYKKGVVLIGDAAAAGDPTWGQGLSVGLRDSRILSDLLISSDDWFNASDIYAAEHDRFYSINHAFENWATKVLMNTGPEADALRAEVMPHLKVNPINYLHVFYDGPN